jgi:hypothetical protein
LNAWLTFGDRVEVDLSDQGVSDWTPITTTPEMCAVIAVT